LTLKPVMVALPCRVRRTITNGFWLESLSEQCDALCQPHEIRLNQKILYFCGHFDFFSMDSLLSGKKKMNNTDIQKWIGKEEISTCIIAVERANLMQATLNRQPTLSNGDNLPPAWHWLYFHDPVQGNALGVEGHPQLGGFMPPISFVANDGNDGDNQCADPPRRMWAGGRFVFEQPLRIGDHATKRSTVKSISPREGRSGKLVFVVVEHELIVEHEVSANNQRCLLEEQTIVYREPLQSRRVPVSPELAPAPRRSDFSAQYQPDPMLLFRYSALTFNTHRIHYDVDFCREHEGYPNLVVHGPLTATLLLDLFCQHCPEKQISSFDYRGHSPLFNPRPFTIHGNKDGRAWASNHAGELAMSAHISF